MINRNIETNDPRKQKRKSERKVPEIEESAAGSRNTNGHSIYYVIHIIIIQRQQKRKYRPFTYY